MFFKRNIDSFRRQNRTLAHSGLLFGLSPAQRHEFLQHCHRREYKQGEYVYYQNDPATGLYFIEQGQVELIAETTGEDSQYQEIRYQLSAPEQFGEFSLGYDIRRKSSAVCLTDCTLLGFFKPDFETLKKRYPLIATYFLEALSARIQQQLERASQELERVAEPEVFLEFRLNLYLKPKEDELPE